MGLQVLQQELTRNRILPVLNSLLKSDRHCYLVGGAVRDALLNRSSHDYDFTTPFDPSDLARGLAKELGGAWFMLDGPRRQSRVVGGQGTKRWSCDFAPFRDNSLDGDLQRRDFTINAMALPLQQGGKLGALYDPLEGQKDLHSSRLRSCSAQVLFDDPLRILKGLRHCLYLQLAIEPSTLIAMRHASPRLIQVAPERIRDELAALLAFSPARRALLWLRELDIVKMLFDVTAETADAGIGLSVLDRVESWTDYLCRADSSHRLEDFFTRELEQGVSNSVAFKLGAWFFGLGVEDTQAVAVLKKLRFSRALQRAVSCLLRLDRQQAEELPNLPSASRSRALWAEDLGSHPQLAVCFLGLMLSAPFSVTAQTLLPVLDDLQRCRGKGKVPNLVAGSWLRNALQLRGPEVGYYLAALRREEIAGRVLNERQAQQFLLRLHESGGQKND